MDLNSDFSTYTMNELIHAYNNMDREKYPDRFKAIVGEIEKRNIKQPEQKKEIKTELQIKQDRLQAVIIWIKRLYLLLVFSSVIAIIYEVIKRLDKEILTSLLSLLVNMSVYLGLKQKKSWLIPLVLINSVMCAFMLLLTIVYPINDSHGLTRKFFAVLLFIFYLYQLKFFSKREVKNIFGETGKTIF